MRRLPFVPRTSSGRGQRSQLPAVVPSCRFFRAPGTSGRNTDADLKFGATGFVCVEASKEADGRRPLPARVFNSLCEAKPTLIAPIAPGTPSDGEPAASAAMSNCDADAPTGREAEVGSRASRTNALRSARRSVPPCSDVSVQAMVLTNPKATFAVH